MSPHDTKNLVYFVNKSKRENNQDENSLSDKKLKQIFDTLAKQAMKEKAPDLQDLEPIIQNSLKSKPEEESELNEESQSDNSTSFTKLLQDAGYIRDKKNWLTNKGFFEIGNKILRDIMKNLNSAEFGLHETAYSGNGNLIIDTTKKFELGDDIKHLSAPHTLLNSIQRISKTSSNITFPILMEPDDLEEFETLEDVRVAVVYCIDLSSTMKQKLGKNVSRIEAAKRALWSLYILNKKFFPNDSIFIVGFASLASLVDPFDIPFLKTYDANDDFLHYTNYQSALRLSRKILQKKALPKIKGSL